MMADRSNPAGSVPGKTLWVMLALITAAAAAGVTLRARSPQSAGARSPGMFQRGSKVPSAMPETAAPSVHQRVVEQGIAVDMTVEILGAGRRGGNVLKEGDDVVFRFELADTANATPLRRAYPAAWLATRTAGEKDDPRRCVRKVQTFLGGGAFSPPEIDLNVYHIVTLNQGATLSVIDPLTGFGGSKLLTLIELAAPGEDSLVAPHQRQIFVSLPEIDRVADVDTSSTWKVVSNLAVGRAPTRLAIQPDGRYLWLAYEPSSASSTTVTAIEVDTLRVAVTLEVGGGPHEFAFADEARSALVTSRGGRDGFDHRPRDAAGGRQRPDRPQADLDRQLFAVGDVVGHRRVRRHDYPARQPDASGCESGSIRARPGTGRRRPRRPVWLRGQPSPGGVADPRRILRPGVGTRLVGRGAGPGRLLRRLRLHPEPRD